MMNNTSYKCIVINIIYYFLPLLVFIIIWSPAINHFYVSNIPITGEMIEKARTKPDDTVLDKIEFFFRSRKSIDEKELITVAEKILQGRIEIPGRPPTRIKIPFDVNDINKSLPKWRLALASFEIPRLLLEAYELTGRNEFFLTARDMISGWASYERSAWLPKGLLWNDHAIAARIAVLSKFWKLYRNHSEYEYKVAEDVLQMAARSGKLLSKPSHFTFSSNHGIMQNLALWQISLAFPILPEVEFYKQLSLERIRDQFAFYINDEGVVLEHSAGYHRDGLEFISLTFIYMTLLNITIPEEWIVKFERAKEFYAQLRRPDGSVPRYGDTGSSKDFTGPLVTNVDVNGRSGLMNYQEKWIPKLTNSIYPVAGYSIWWDGLDYWPDEEKLSQTVVVWSYFPGQAHKHADDMSILIYAGGQTWLTNTGFWDYGVEGRSNAVSWEGSNAPHLKNEKRKSIRNTQLKSSGKSNNFLFIDLERKGPNGYIARRQVLYIKPGLWLVLDNTYGEKNSRTTTTWTTFSNIKLTKGSLPGSFYLRGKKEGVLLSAFLSSSENEEIKMYRGSKSPFAGWIGRNPADAIVIEQPVDSSWSLAIWSLENGNKPSLQFTGQPYMQNWESPEEWKIVLPVEKGLFSIWREGNSVYVNEGIRSKSTKLIKLTKASDISDKYENIRTGYKNAASKYPQFRALLSYRWKMTYFLIFVFILQEIFFLIYNKIHGKHYAGFRMLTIPGWAGIVGLWFMIVYLKA